MSATAFEAGLAIVILAIVLDRLTDAAGEWLSPRAQRRPRPEAAGAGSTAAIVLAAGAIAPAVARRRDNVPEAIQVSFRPINPIVGWFTGTFSTATIGLQERRDEHRPEPARRRS